MCNNKIKVNPPVAPAVPATSPSPNAITVISIADLDKAVAGADKVISGVLASLTERTDTALKQADEKMSEVAAEAQSRVIETLGAIVLLTIAAGVVMTLSITRPISKAVSVAETLARGELEIDIGETTRDETGQLLRALNKMNRNLVEIVGFQQRHFVSWYLRGFHFLDWEQLRRMTARPFLPTR